METNNNNNNNNNSNSNSNLTNNNVSWDHIWDNNNISGTNSQSATTTRYDWTNLPFSSATSSRREQQQPEASVVHALLFGNTAFHDAGRVGWPDPHMMCLKLGKRHYCDDTVVGVPDRCVMTAESSSAAAKRGKLPVYQVTDSRWPGVRVTSSTRCQVEGCNVALGNAKEYYRRHKVCEIHSKAPKVVVSGLQQRFCQQCSRFHDVTEFDEAKRSCRRRLEGHNLRRRKGTVSHSIPRNFPQSHENNSTMEHQLGPLSTLQSSSSSPSKPVCALSLLSSSKTEPWIPSGDLSLRCSAALYELICANRATSASGHFFNQNSSHQPILDNTMHTSHDTNRSSRTTMTLDVKQAPALDFGLLAMKEESKDPDVWTDYCWSPFGGANVV